MDRNSWGDPEFIDRYAWTARHELKHVSQMTGFWGATTFRNDEDDADAGVGDYIPDDEEATYGRGGYDNTKYATYDDEVDFGQNPIPDSEDICMRKTASPYDVDELWDNGTCTSVDWANPGKQY